MVMKAAKAFTFASTKALAVEYGGATKLAAHLLPLNACRPLVITDPGVVSAGLLDGAKASLKSAGMSVCIYSDTVADPPDSLVLQATEIAREHGADSIIGFGGDSSMDIAVGAGRNEVRRKVSFRLKVDICFCNPINLLVA